MVPKPVEQVLVLVQNQMDNTYFLVEFLSYARLADTYHVSPGVCKNA